LSQPFFVAEQFTGTPWVYVKIDDTVAGFKKIIDGEMDHVPEKFFLYKSGINDVIEAFEKETK
jgi:F-type H+-transporting ATPase subunit beta